jgi:hypothetical protein
MLGDGSEMRNDRRLLVGIWLVVALAVAAGGFLVVRSITTVPDLPGRADPSAIYDEPTLLFEDPGLLGSAVERLADEVVRDCMASRGYDYRGPAAVDDLDGLADPDAAGYGIAAGLPVGDVSFPARAPSGTLRTGYEVALYGSTLGDAGDDGGCAALGRSATAGAVEVLRSLPYPLERLEAEAAAHPAYTEALAAWSACMASRGYSATAPEDLMAGFRERLADAGPAEARALADEERRTAADDFACREATLEPALDEVAADLAPVFVESNRPQLEQVIPPPGGEAAQSPGLGTGDVQVTLRWSSAADLDLSVVDPFGDRISYSARTSPSGGELDRDANFPCVSVAGDPVENVYWPPGEAPAGSYRTSVAYRTTCATPGAQAFVLTVRVRGTVVLQDAGTLEPGETVEYGFEVDG